MYLLYPEVCVVCNRVLPRKHTKKGLCPDCRKRLHSVGEKICGVCGKEIDTPLANRCRDCTKRSHEFISCRSLFVYQGEIKKTMYRFKYSNARYMGRFFAAEAKKKYGEWIKLLGVQAVVPVPMYPRKKRQRGYNQAEVFGKALAKQLKVPCLTNLVKRNKNTLPQKCLSREKREENLKNAFKMGKYNVKLNCVLIVDDIYTTGTTMDAVTHVLKENGIENVFCLTICIGVDT